MATGLPAGKRHPDPDLFWPYCPRLRFFRLAGRSSGNAVGKYLLSMGHRRIACISQFSREKFSFVAQRFAGLVLAWRSARLPISHITFRCPESNGLTPSAPPAATKAMATPASGILTKPQMEMIFDELRQDTDITAWVTINDNLMQQVYKYFGSLLPNGVSLVSFDDLPEAVYFGVTSFNFNHSRLADAMLAAILSPPSLDKSMGETLIEQPGQLIVRRSVYHVPAIS
jgi:DNA-binding LacI/PurR family transcriptional regulator